MGLLSMFASNNWLSINRDLMKILGLKTTVLLGELCSEYDHWEREGKLVDDMFFCSIEHLEDRTTLSRYEQTVSINQLKELGILDVILKGVPATRYFKFNKPQFVNFLQSRLLETDKLDCKKLYSSNTNNTRNNKIDNVSTIVDTEISKEIPSNSCQNTDTMTQGSGSNKNKQNKSNIYNRTPQKVLTNEKKPNLWEKCVSEIDKRYDGTSVQSALMEYLPYRLKSTIHPIGFSGWVGLLNKLDKFGTTDEEKCKIIEQSIKMKWDTFVELKTWGRKSNDKSVFGENDNMQAGAPVGSFKKGVIF